MDGLHEGRIRVDYPTRLQDPHDLRHDALGLQYVFKHRLNPNRIDTFVGERHLVGIRHKLGILRRKNIEGDSLDTGQSVKARSPDTAADDQNQSARNLP